MVEEEPIIGPLPPRPRKRPLDLEQTHLDSLPSATMYENSYTHLDVVTHVAVSQEAQVLITGSADGDLKFWKKKPIGIEFAKHFKSHHGPIKGLAVGADGSLCCTISNDKSVKIYDVNDCDMIVKMQLPYVPGTIEWVYMEGHESRLAISDRKSPRVYMYDTHSSTDHPTIFKEIHTGPVKVMKYNHSFDTVISADDKGSIEYWCPVKLQFPQDRVSFKLISDTSLLEVVKCKTTVSAIEVSPDGEKFAITSPDRKIRVFHFRSGMLRQQYDESLEVAQGLQRDNVPLYMLEANEFGRRVAVEEGIERTENVPQPNAIFDESSNFIIYATLHGIKIVNLETNEVKQILGKAENNDRFLKIALFQGFTSKKVRKIPAAAANVDESRDPSKTDPTLLCCSFNKQRIYLFSRREPNKGRDGKSPADEVWAASTSLPKKIMHTELGDIHIKLYRKRCPKTVENFTSLCRIGFYDDLIFHRVVKGVMIQTGSPHGDGYNGKSIWGKDFEDEFHRSLRHNKPFTVSMVNASTANARKPNTNGSQFLITGAAAMPWMDNIKTVFGRVVKGMDVVQGIEKVEVNRNLDFKPYRDVKILKVTFPK
ncbi:hypothetical protein MKW92_050637 [Papaver armeniacum]|nr:hypothetical protein MKW92_050637 [Papaver armeniacum]